MKIISNLPNITAPTGARPDGALKDVSAPAAGDGTPARSDWQNDLYYALLTLMDTVGVSADDSDEEFEAGVGSQFLDAMRLFVQEWAYPGLDFGLKNISGGNQASDITIYEAGGGSEKEDGFTVRLRWTGGDGTFAHTITAANTVGNEMAGFIASSNWEGQGEGELVLRLDKTNSKWLMLTPGVWDTGSNSNGKYIKYADGTMICRRVSDETSNGGVFNFTWTYPHVFIAIEFIDGSSSNIPNTGGGGGAVLIPSDNVLGLSSVAVRHDTTTGAVAYKIFLVAIGTWR